MKPLIKGLHFFKPLILFYARISHGHRQKIAPGLHPDRIDDRHCDHRHFGGDRHSGIPNYTIRAQVTEGLTLADGWKTAIAEYYANTGNWPLQGNLTGTTVSAGKYESNVTVIAGGVIQITYGGPAVNAKISGCLLKLTPYTNANNDVIWQCGLNPIPSTASASIASGAISTGTTVSPQYLPTACHS